MEEQTLKKLSEICGTCKMLRSQSDGWGLVYVYCSSNGRRIACDELPCSLYIAKMQNTLVMA